MTKPITSDSITGNKTTTKIKKMAAATYARNINNMQIDVL